MNSQTNGGHVDDDEVERIQYFLRELGQRANQMAVWLNLASFICESPLATDTVCCVKQGIKTHANERESILAKKISANSIINTHTCIY